MGDPMNGGPVPAALHGEWRRLLLIGMGRLKIQDLKMQDQRNRTGICRTSRVKQ